MNTKNKIFTIAGSIIIFGLIIYTQLPDFFDSSFITEDKTENQNYTKDENSDWSKCYDNLEMPSNAAVYACLKDSKNKLLNEREVIFNELMTMDNSKVDPNFDMTLEDVRVAVSSWYKMTDDYRQKYCDAFLISYSWGSAYPENNEECHIKMLRSDIQFLKDRIYEIEHYSDNWFD